MLIAPAPEHVGRYARSIESGWLGKVIAIEGEYLKMQGVNQLYRNMLGGDIEDALDSDDFQWFTPDDVRFVKLIPPTQETKTCG